LEYRAFASCDILSAAKDFDGSSDDRHQLRNALLSVRCYWQAALERALGILLRRDI